MPRTKSRYALPEPRAESDVACVFMSLKMLMRQYRALLSIDPTVDYRLTSKHLQLCGYDMPPNTGRMYPMSPIIKRAHRVMKSYIDEGKGPRVFMWRMGQSAVDGDEDDGDIDELFDSEEDGKDDHQGSECDREDDVPKEDEEEDEEDEKDEEEDEDEDEGHVVRV